jgi:hypothetical protein
MLLDERWWSPVPFAAQVVICFFVGYSIISYRWYRISPLPVVAAIIVGIEVSATLYALLASFHQYVIGFLLIGALAVFGAFRACQVVVGGKSECRSGELMFENYALAVGLATMIALGSAFYFSGRLGTGGYSFYGPMSRDHIFHLALIGRLRAGIPPDNFIASGYPFQPYHFLSDVTLYLLQQTSGQLYPLLDLYYRLYPGIIMLAVGFLAFLVPAEMHNSRRAGFVGAGLILFGGNLSWLLGAAQTLRYMFDVDGFRARLFEPWLWTGVGTLYPLVHRPAHYHGLVILLVGLAAILRKGSKDASAWAIAGLILGLLAGFNYLLAFACGLSICLAAIGQAVWGSKRNFVNAALCTFVLALASIPANYFVLYKVGMSHAGYASAIHFSYDAMAQYAFGALFERLPGILRSAFSVAMFLVISYGLCLFGVPSLARGYINCLSTRRVIGALLAICFAVCFLLGFFIRYDVRSFAINIAILEPTVWLLAFFAVRPITSWLSSTGRFVRGCSVAFLVLIGPAQAIPLFNLGYKVVLSRQFVEAMDQIKRESALTDVVAAWPESVKAYGILGKPPEAANFYISALSGLRSYFSVRGYTEQATGDDKEVYHKRYLRVLRVVTGRASAADIDLMRSQHVRWVVVLSSRAPAYPELGVTVWRAGPDFTILRIGEG